MDDSPEKRRIIDGYEKLSATIAERSRLLASGNTTIPRMVYLPGKGPIVETEEV